MKVTHLSNSVEDRAGFAAHSLHKALLEEKLDSVFLTKEDIPCGSSSSSKLPPLFSDPRQLADVSDHDDVLPQALRECPACS